jgi:hypothetical protein
LHGLPLEPQGLAKQRGQESVEPVRGGARGVRPAAPDHFSYL